MNDVAQKANGPQIVSRKFKQNSWRTWSALWSALKRVGLFVPLLSLPSGIFGTIQAAWAGTVTHTYDVMDRLVTRTDATGGVERFAYDGLGNLIRYTDRKGQQRTLTYDPLNRWVGASYADGSSAEFTYDAGSRLTLAKDSVGGTFINRYDLLDRLTAQGTNLGTIQYTYDALGRRTSMTMPGQTPVTYTYDATSRLTQVSQGSQSVTIQYDPAGRRTRLTLPNEVSTEYQYDAASRLTAMIFRNASGILGNLTYAYDSSGNRVAVGGSFARTGLPAAAMTATYDVANRQLAFGDKQMTYDANGSVTSITGPSGTTIFTWDARNRLDGMNGPGVTASFTYDAFNRRNSKTVNGVTTQYFYDGFNVVQEVRENVIVNHLTDLTPDAPWVRNGTEFYLADGLGSIIGLTDASGNLVTRYTYEPFGKTTQELGSSTNPVQFTAREHDGTGFYYYRARYYHPELQRFLSEDPIGFEGGDVNLYAYVFNNPVDFTDPSGTRLFLPLPEGAVSSECRNTPEPEAPPALGGRKDASGPPGGLGEAVRNLARGIARTLNCDPSLDLLPGGIGMARGPIKGAKVSSRARMRFAGIINRFVTLKLN